MSTRDVLKKLMTSRDISVRKLSKVLGMNRSTLGSIISGTNESPRDKTLVPIAKYFGVSLGQLRGYEPIDGLTDGSVAPNEYPILDETNIADWIREDPQVEYSGTVRSAEPKGPRTFMYIAKDNAISPLVPEGGECFVDPEFEFPEPFEGTRLALIEVNGHYALRVQSSDLGDVIYKPIGSGFKTLSADQCTLVGYVVSFPERSWRNLSQ